MKFHSLNKLLKIKFTYRNFGMRKKLEILCPLRFFVQFFEGIFHHKHAKPSAKMAIFISKYVNILLNPFRTFV